MTRVDPRLPAFTLAGRVSLIVDRTFPWWTSSVVARLRTVPALAAVETLAPLVRNMIGRPCPYAILRYASPSSLPSTPEKMIL